MDTEDNKILQIGSDTEATSGSNGGRMFIIEEAANEASDGLENQGNLLSCIDNRTVTR